MARRLLKGSSMFMRTSMLTSPLGSTACRRFERTSGVCARVELDERGFTLVELMTVVAIIGVLATLSTYGVRKYLLHAKKAEASSMLTQIRAAEEAYRDETFQYLGASSATNFGVWHPTSTPTPGRRDWGATTTMGTNVLLPLGVRPDGPVNYSYAVTAGLAGDTLPTIPTTRVWSFPAPTGPYYIAMAKADLNGDGTYTYALSHSDTSEIYFDDDL
jgi:prepilin-type N-terminal cleavage/methylation domain-containing protein